MFITHDFLRSMKPCRSGYKRFCELWPEGVTLDEARTGFVADGHPGRSEWIARIVAENPETPVDTLSTLAKDVEWSVRAAVARNPATPTDTLVALAGDEDWCVRRAVAANPATPSTTLVALAGDTCRDVRLAEDLSVGLLNEQASNPNDMWIHLMLSADQYAPKIEKRFANREEAVASFCEFARTTPKEAEERFVAKGLQGTKSQFSAKINGVFHFVEMKK